MKEIISIRSFILLTLLLLASNSVLAYDFQVDKLYYTINGNEVTVSKSDYINDLVIPKTVSYNGKTYSVTAIGDNAFEYHHEIKTVSIPNTIKSIGEYGFYYCSAITVINIPNSVKTLGNYAFSGCENVVELTIGSGVTSIGSSAFSHCYGLTSVKIPDSVTSIGDCAFWYCNNLNEAIIGNGVTTIPVAAFRGCAKLTKVTLGESVTSLDDSSFGECESLTEVNLPNSLTSIGGTVFYGCSSLGHIIIPNSVVSIGNMAFYHCSSLPSITIPAGVNVIGYSAFEGCTSLAEVYSYIMNPNAVQMQWSTFLEVPTSTSVLYVPKGKVNAYKEHEEWGVFTHIVEMEGGLKGDVNGDGEVNIADVNALIDIILGGSGNTFAADVNGDGEVNIADVNTIINIILGGGVPSQNHEYVDLGLPSGTLWATTNVGANNPEDYGSYFAWGETKTKEMYNWSTYKWCKGSINTLTKYCRESENGFNGFTDGKNELDPEDDAAYVNWGKSWRMPTIDQQRELVNNCTWTWTTRNGVGGHLVTGPNGKSLFLPAAGTYWSNSLSGGGSWGRYLSRNIDNDYSFHACYMYFTSNFLQAYNYDYRYEGYTVRAVRVS